MLISNPKETTLQDPMEFQLLKGAHWIEPTPVPLFWILNMKYSGHSHPLFFTRTSAHLEQVIIAPQQHLNVATSPLPSVYILTDCLNVFVYQDIS